MLARLSSRTEYCSVGTAVANGSTEKNIQEGCPMAQKDCEGAEFDQFFSSNGLKVEGYEPRGRSFVGVVGPLAGLVAFSVRAGVFVAITGFVWGSAAVQVAASYEEF